MMTKVEWQCGGGKVGIIHLMLSAECEINPHGASTVKQDSPTPLLLFNSLSPLPSPPQLSPNQQRKKGPLPSPPHLETCLLGTHIHSPNADFIEHLLGATCYPRGWMKFKQKRQD